MNVAYRLLIHKQLLLAISFILILLHSSISHAALISYRFTGTVETTFGAFFANEGTALSGTIMFDDGLTDNNYTTSWDTFRTSDPNEFIVSLTVGSITVSHQASDVNRGNVSIVDSAITGDSVAFELPSPSTPGAEFRLYANDITGNAVAQGSGNLTGQMSDAIAYFNFLDPAVFPDAQGRWIIVDSSGSATDAVGFIWDTFEHCSPFPGGGATGGCFPGPGLFPGHKVPEPSTLSILGIGLLGFGFMRRKSCTV